MIQKLKRVFAHLPPHLTPTLRAYTTYLDLHVLVAMTRLAFNGVVT